MTDVCVDGLEDGSGGLDGEWRACAFDWEVGVDVGRVEVQLSLSAGHCAHRIQIGRPVAGGEEFSGLCPTSSLRRLNGDRTGV